MHAIRLCLNSYIDSYLEMSFSIDLSSTIYCVLDDLLLPDLNHIVFEYADSYEVKLFQMNTLEERIVQLLEEKSLLNTEYQNKLKQITIDSVHDLKTVIREWSDYTGIDPKITWFNDNNYFAFGMPLPRQSAVQFFLQVLWSTSCITSEYSLWKGYYRRATVMISRFVGANQDVTLSTNPESLYLRSR